jgi:cytochrome c biogenesis protein CcdA
MSEFSIFLILGILLYFLPAFVAQARHHKNRLAIGMLNLLLGWSVVGWVGAMVWACTANTEPRHEEDEKAAATSAGDYWR